MIASIKRHIRRRKLTNTRTQLARLRALRNATLEKEFALRGQLAVLESGL